MTRRKASIASPAAPKALLGDIRALIEANYPDHGIAGEEYGTVRGDADRLWSLDPIDGTRRFGGE